MAPHGSETKLEPTYSNKFGPFKSVLHRQACFARFTLVDKFGQIIVAVEPEQRKGENTTETASDATLWRMSLISAFRYQLARGAECRLSNDGDANTAPITFKIASEFENLVLGWLVANYMDEAIQIFDHETKGRLAEFVASLTANPALVPTFFALFAEATDSRLSTATDFASLLSLTAAFSRPFVLADTGVSIEPSTPLPKDTPLLIGSKAQPETSITDYTFQATFGNLIASSNGLVATFASSGLFPLTPSLRDDQEDDETLDPQIPIAIKSYFIPSSDTEFTKAHVEQRVRTSCIVDPVLAVQDALRRMEAFLTPMLLLILRVSTILAPPPTLSEEGRTVVKMPLSGAVADGNGTVRFCARRESDPWDDTAVGPVSALLDIDASRQSEVANGLIIVQTA
ncbi:hypothetical protein F5Y19DRAFT_493306 [Xylariaceae sp. FL1651]|nr:hypothetical protein F5Y19DRAFT_493306 [Xylariaceae sp. FL1651]